MSISLACPHCGRHLDLPDSDAGVRRKCFDCGGPLTVPAEFSHWAEDAPEETPRRGWRWWLPLSVAVPVLIVGLCLVGQFVAVVLPMMGSTREQARQAACRSQLADLVNAMYEYEKVHGNLPPAFVAGPDGKPWHSWRVLLLPHLKQKALFDEYRQDEPWDGPHNRQLHSRILGAYHCPSDEADLSRTSYFVVTGPGTMFEPGKKLKSSDATDGQSTTLLIVEAAGQNVHWMEPRDLDLAALAKALNLKDKPSISSRHPGLAYVAYVDGSVEPLADNVSPTVLQGMLTRNGGEVVPTGDPTKP